MIQINGKNFGARTRPQDFGTATFSKKPFSDKKVPQEPVTVALIDDDDAFREQLARNLIEKDLGVVAFGGGNAALDYFAAGHGCDVVLLDWNMPILSGAETLDRFRAAGLRIPVVVLTACCDEKTEEAALDHGAVDALDKSRNASILAKRLRIIARGAQPRDGREAIPDMLVRGPLTLKTKTHRAFWRGEPVPLTVTAFRIVCLLASRAGEDVPYREIYDVVHGKAFKAGEGVNGFHANVRSLIRHVRRKFRMVDANFAAIENYPGFGYRWRAAEPWRREGADSRGAAGPWPGGAAA